MKITKSMIFSILTVFVLVGCAKEGEESKGTSSNNKEKLSVVTTFYPVYEFTEKVAGDRANIEMMISGGTDVHHYEPSAKDMAMINDADMFVYSSDEMETWVPSMLDSLDNSDLLVVEQAEAIELLEPNEETSGDHDHDSEHNDDDDHDHAVDPHIWLDPVLVQQQVETMKETLIEVDPEHSRDYSKRAEAYQGELQELDRELAEAFKDAKQRRFVTQHEAFGYLADRYDLNQMAVGGLSTEVEVSPSRIAEINHKVEEYAIPIIYFQEGANSAIAETIANEIGVEVAELYSLEYLPQNIEDKGQGYIEAMRKNLEALKMSIY
ncbi:MAG: metal ABC transporter solute-binding protein, Zn/Mn family [Alkalibacterium gilvum]|uniref:Zinc transport system substrate-binding protein n=1 Tax=Alkalibacterium gilvum TaxID=1130080 RepID=A0A1H6SES6_9LACT|nr:zinc ABC transporter substrate-binding protein [Alkalibacterium gilvum]MDN6729371.1 zinc ABC transporter substrate-binding protein [Alkalibacterium sp.]SEI65356.1 zinc transport system substrate-binding protein [Alkalibacterium gilvum]